MTSKIAGSMTPTMITSSQSRKLAEVIQEIPNKKGWARVRDRCMKNTGPTSRTPSQTTWNHVMAETQIPSSSTYAGTQVSDLLANIFLD